MSGTPRSAPHTRRHSRRSTGSINFTQMSVSPLTSASITEQDFQQPPKAHNRRSGSYIQGVSAPTTPGILSRTHSFQRSTATSPLPKSKSSSQLTHHEHAQEWMHRTGAALTSEARESKGQGWLSTRASSTSLVRLADDDDNDQRQVYANNESSPASPMWGRGSEYDYMDVGMAHLENGEAAESDEDDFDLSGGYRLGQFMDRLIGWSVFAEDDTDSDDEVNYEQKPVEHTRERIQLAPLEEEKLREQRQRRDEDEGWQDPAWLFSIVLGALF